MMAKAAVIYYSRTGTTKQMAEAIAAAMNDAKLPTDCRDVEQVKPDDLLELDAIVVGSPTYYGQMAAPIKQLFDDLVSKHGALDGKVGAAFSSSANLGGGNETTVMGIIEAMLICGLVVQGDPVGAHYGPVSVGRPDRKVEQQCARLGRRVAALVAGLAE
jgi:NAD(P)H dehydrogenase (quinone)